MNNACQEFCGVPCCAGILWYIRKQSNLKLEANKSKRPVLICLFKSQNVYFESLYVCVFESWQNWTAACDEYSWGLNRYAEKATISFNRAAHTYTFSHSLLVLIENTNWSTVETYNLKLRQLLQFQAWTSGINYARWLHNRFGCFFSSTKSLGEGIWAREQQVLTGTRPNPAESPRERRRGHERKEGRERRERLTEGRRRRLCSGAPRDEWKIKHSLAGRLTIKAKDVEALSPVGGQENYPHWSGNVLEE